MSNGDQPLGFIHVAAPLSALFSKEKMADDMAVDDAAATALAAFEAANDIQEVDVNLYRYDAAAHKALVDAEPWKKECVWLWAKSVRVLLIVSLRVALQPQVLQGCAHVWPRHAQDPYACQLRRPHRGDGLVAGSRGGTRHACCRRFCAPRRGH